MRFKPNCIYADWPTCHCSERPKWLWIFTAICLLPYEKCGLQVKHERPFHPFFRTSQEKAKMVGETVRIINQTSELLNQTKAKFIQGV